MPVWSYFLLTYLPTYLLAYLQVLEGPFARVVGGGDDSSEQWAVLLLKILLDQTLFSALINLLYASLNGLLSNLPPREAFARARQVYNTPYA